MNDQQDQDLVQQFLAGNAAAFGILYRKYYRRVLGYCLRLIHDRSAVEDVVQTIFIKAAESIRTLKQPELFYYWIFSIARNECFAMLRKTKIETVRIDDEHDEPWEEATPYDLVVRDETSAVVTNAVDQLKAEYRELIILRQFEQLSYREIAMITGDSISSIESRLFKARRVLAHMLTPYFEKERNGNHEM